MPVKQFHVARGGAHGFDGAPLAGAVVAIGNFDGVHRGHRAVIDAALRRAHAFGGKAAALTFSPHPRLFLRPQEPLFQLSSERNKLRLLAASGLSGAFVMTFDAALASTSAQDFVERILVGALGIRGAAIGFDFHFGKNRTGSPAFLTEQGARLGFAVDIVPPLEDEGRPVSSGAVRAALAAGRVVEATELLGAPWFVSGDVASFGRRPMFDDGAPLLEVYLFDFDGDLYGQTIDVAFIGWIRHEQKFDSVDILKRQMASDTSQARDALKRAANAFPLLGDI